VWSLEWREETDVRMLRELYVGGWRVARRAAVATGLLSRLERARNPVARHVRTLFAIHDVVELSRLDLPWWTYPATRELEEVLASRRGAARVFEYGAGASTLWLARRAAEVWSVEHDERFVEFLRPLLSEVTNVHLMHVVAQRVPEPVVTSERSGYEGLDFSDYVASIDRVDGEFDVIVVDGRARAACLHHAARRLSATGVILFDDSGRRRYAEAIASSGLRVYRRSGWAPSLPYRSQTALLRAG
jgi:predicted O-methyltransferase YrrM